MARILLSLLSVLLLGCEFDNTGKPYGGKTLLPLMGGSGGTAGEIGIGGTKEQAGSGGGGGHSAIATAI